MVHSLQQLSINDLLRNMGLTLLPVARCSPRAMVKVKSLLKKSSDPYLALLSYRTAPLVHGYCPSELLMGRLLRSTLPITRNQRKPQFIDPVAVAHKTPILNKSRKSILIADMEFMSFPYYYQSSMFGLKTGNLVVL